MVKSSKIELSSKIYHFVGRRGALYLALGAFTGVLVFATELAFATTLQLFLVVMKIVPMTSTRLPSWIPASNDYLFLVIITATIVARGFAQWLNNVLISGSYEIQRDHQRYRLVDWAFRAPSVSTSELVTLYHQGIEEVGTVLTNVQSASVYISTALLIWFFMLRISWKTTLVATAVFGCIGYFAKLLNTYSTCEGQRLLTRMEDINLRLLSNIKNLLLVQIYGTQDRERKILRQKLTEVTSSVLRYQRFVHLKYVAPQIIGFVFICTLSMVAVHRNWIAPIVMVTFFYLFMRFVQSFSELVRLSSSISFSLPTARQFFKWWVKNGHENMPNPVDALPKTSRLVLDGPVGWTLKDISFSYPESSNRVFEKFSLIIPEASSLVIIGESGSGKSTLLSLLLGVSHPQDGDLNLEVNQRSLPLAEVRQSLLPHVGYVGSETFLIAGSIRENLLYGLDTVPTEHEIQQALKISECDFVSQFKEGLNHMISEQGHGMSAGQKQRLSFARALLRNPKVLILDEATANLDAETERNLIETLKKLKKSTTMVVVTHREALLSLADQVVKLPTNMASAKGPVLWGTQ